MTTHYHTLGIPIDATSERVKDAYRALVKTFHPDLFPTDSDAQAQAGRRIREVNVAYAVLSNPERRESYDAKLNIHTNKKHDTSNTNKVLEQVPGRCSKCGKPTLTWHTVGTVVRCKSCEVRTSAGSKQSY
jgi:DnaJ-class molecular chaperone